MDATFLTWGLGLCATGFFVLLAIVGRQNDKIEALKVEMEKRVSYKWIEQKLDKEFSVLNKSMAAMNDALIGSVDKRGLLTAFHHHDERIRSLEDRK